MKFSFQTEILIRKLEEVLYKKNFVWKAITLFIRYMKSLANPRVSKIQIHSSDIHCSQFIVHTKEEDKFILWKAKMISFKCCFQSCNVFNITDWTLIPSHEQSIKAPLKPIVITVLEECLWQCHLSSICWMFSNKWWGYIIHYKLKPKHE